MTKRKSFDVAKSGLFGGAKPANSVNQSDLQPLGVLSRNYFANNVDRNTFSFAKLHAKKIHLIIAQKPDVKSSRH